VVRPEGFEHAPPTFLIEGVGLLVAKLLAAYTVRVTDVKALPAQSRMESRTV
jgi:hypothetical protein